jgi:hypothetical protein
MVIRAPRKLAQFTSGSNQILELEAIFTEQPSFINCNLFDSCALYQLQDEGRATDRPSKSRKRFGGVYL